MVQTQRQAVAHIRYLHSHGISCILYGSTGVSLHLGEYKRSFGDVDLLVPPEYLQEKWPQLIDLMAAQGFMMVDEREHEFKKDTASVAFASQSILQRDGIVLADSDLVQVPLDGYLVTTLTPAAFLRAYQFSARDGYRRTTRKKNDDTVIARLKCHGR